MKRPTQNTFMFHAQRSGNLRGFVVSNGNPRIRELQIGVDVLASSQGMTVDMQRRVLADEDCYPYHVEIGMPVNITLDEPVTECVMYIQDGTRLYYIVSEEGRKP